MSGELIPHPSFSASGESRGSAPIQARPRTSSELSRLGAANALHQAFELIGGVNRLTLWANAHPDKFYPLWAKLLPSQSLTIHGDNTKVEIVHSLPATALDDHK